MKMITYVVAVVSTKGPEKGHVLEVLPYNVEVVRQATDITAAVLFYEFLL